MSGALSHVRVLDLTRFLAGPFCTSILADMGAEVVKVEAPKGGDEGRYGYPPVDGVPVFFLALNRGKQGITLDLRQEDARALAPGACRALPAAPSPDRRQPLRLRPDGSLARAPLVRHHHAGRERLH